MKSYQYIARDASGARKEGFSQAVCTNDVLGWLREKGLTPISVNEISAGAKAPVQASSRQRVKSGDLAALCWQLTTMVGGGIPLTTAIDSISTDVEHPRLQAILQYVSGQIQKGETFSDCLSEFPKVFNPLTCAIISAGETGGTLPESLRRLAEYFDNRDKLAKKVKGAVAYPAFIFIVIILIVTFIMTFIVPRFQVIFEQLGGDLPGFTQGFMNVYSALRYNFVYIIGSVLLLIFSAILTGKTKKGHYIFSRIALKVPLLGKIFSQAFITMFCKTMSTLLAAGVSVLEVFDIMSGMTNNDVIKDAIVRTRERIVEGSNISSSLAASGFFPSMVVKMIQVGEESGSLSKVLDKTSDYYERKVDSTITTVMSLLEPMMIVLVAGIVMVVVLALYLPIFSMSDAAR